MITQLSSSNATLDLIVVLLHGAACLAVIVAVIRGYSGRRLP